MRTSRTHVCRRNARTERAAATSGRRTRRRLRRRHFLYDSLSMARAHCRFPLLRRPSLVWIHGIEVWEKTVASHLRCARRADILVANSAYTRQRADRLHGGFQRAEICWLGTETDDEPVTVPSSDCRPTVLILGRMDELQYKGHTELIDCWPRVVNAVAARVCSSSAEALYKMNSSGGPAPPPSPSISFFVGSFPIGTCPRCGARPRFSPCPAAAKDLG